MDFHVETCFFKPYMAPCGTDVDRVDRVPYWTRQMRL